MIRFLIPTLALLAAGCAATGSSSHEGQLRHVVLFDFQEAATPEQISAVEDAFRALPSQVPEILDFEWGTDVSTENLSDGFTHCFLVTFDDAAARDAYLPHPAHQAFVELIGPVIEKVLVVDYYVGR